MQPVESSTGSGAVVSVSSSGGGEARLVLTAAHVVADTRYLQVQRSTDRFSSEKFRAAVVAVCHEVDLALVSVENPEAFGDIEPLAVAAPDELPLVFDKVRVVGYPVGGDAVSVTEGVVSRVEVQEYSHSMRAGLALTVDAAINSGNSGGPVLDAVTDRLLGVAFQKLVARGVELQGHAVPAQLIQRFLGESLAALDGPPGPPLYLAMPALGCDLQSLESPALRRSLGLGDSDHGVLVNRVHHSGDSAPALREGDVLLAFDGRPLDNLGFCELLGRRLHFAAARDLCASGSVVSLKIWREGHELTIAHTLLSQHFVPRGQYDVLPSFYICGGLVFQPLSHDYLQGWSAGDRPPHLQHLFMQGRLSPERTEAVMLSQVLADDVNKGYDSGWVGAPIVTSVNGEAVRDLAHLVHLVRAARLGGGGFLRFDLETGTSPFRLVLPTAGLDEADARVHQMYGVPVPGCSEDFMET